MRKLYLLFVTLALATQLTVSLAQAGRVGIGMHPTEPVPAGVGTSPGGPRR